MKYIFREELQTWRLSENEINYFLYKQGTLKARPDIKPETNLGRALMDYNFKKIVKYLFRTAKLKK